MTGSEACIKDWNTSSKAKEEETQITHGENCSKQTKGTFKACAVPCMYNLTKNAFENPNFYLVAKYNADQ